MKHTPDGTVACRIRPQTDHTSPSAILSQMALLNPEPKAAFRHEPGLDGPLARTTQGDRQR